MQEGGLAPVMQRALMDQSAQGNIISSLAPTAQGMPGGPQMQAGIPGMANGQIHALSPVTPPMR
jgi:hypothetical protein